MFGTCVGCFSFFFMWIPINRLIGNYFTPINQCSFWDQYHSTSWNTLQNNLQYAHIVSGLAHIIISCSGVKGRVSWRTWYRYCCIDEWSAGAVSMFAPPARILNEEKGMCMINLWWVLNTSLVLESTPSIVSCECSSLLDQLLHYWETRWDDYSTCWLLTRPSWHSRALARVHCVVFHIKRRTERNCTASDQWMRERGHLWGETVQ